MRITPPLLDQYYESAPEPEAAERRARRVWILNKRLVVILLVLGTMLGVGGHFWHGYQVRKNADALRMHAERLVDENHARTAADYLHRYLQLRPDDRDVRVQLAMVYGETAVDPMRIDRALELYDHALGVAPGKHDLRLRKAELLLAREQYTAAMSQADEAMTAGADEAACWRVKATAALRRQQSAQADAWDEVIELLLKAFELNPADVQLAEQCAVTLREQATELSRAQQQQQADAVMDRLVAAAPRNPAGWLARSNYRLRFGLPGVEDDLQQAAQIEPNHADVLVAQAWQLIANGDLQQAEQLCRAALKSNSGHERAHAQLAELQVVQGKQAEAVETLQAGVGLHGAMEVDFRSDLIVQLLQLERLDEAGHELRSFEALAEKVQPQLPLSARLLLGATLELHRAQLEVAEGQLRPAQQRLSALLTQAWARSWKSEQPRRFASASRLLAHCHHGLGEWDLAAPRFQDGITVGAATAADLHTAATLFEAAGKPTQAMEYYRRSAESPDGTFEAAIGWLRITLSQQPDAPGPQEPAPTVQAALTLARARVADSDQRRSQLRLYEAIVEFATGSHQGGLKILEQAVEEADGSADQLLAIANLYRQVGAHEAAERLCARVEAAGPTAASSLLRCELLLARGDATAAIAVLEKQLASTSNDAADQRRALMLKLVELKARIGQLPAARSLLASYAVDHRHDQAVQLLLCELALAANDTAGCANAVEQLRLAEGAMGCQWREVRARSLLLLTGGSPAAVEQATGLHREIVERRPNWPPAHTLRGLIAQADDNSTEAIAALRQAVEMGEQRPWVHSRLVLLLVAEYRLTEARRLLTQIPLSEQAASRLIPPVLSAQLQAGETSSALETAQFAAARIDDTAALLNIAGQLAAASERDAAESLLQQRLVADPSEPSLWLALIRLAAQHGDDQVIDDLLRQLAANDELGAVERSLTLAQAHEVRGAAPEAHAAYLAAIKQAPDNLPVLRGAAVFFLRSGAPEAESTLRRIIELAPDDNSATRALAVLLANSQRAVKWQEAWQLLEADVGTQDTSVNRLLRAQMLLSQDTPESRQQAVDLLHAGSEAELTVEHRLLLAKALERVDRFDDACQLLEAATREEACPPVLLAAYVDLLLRGDQAGAATAPLQRLEAVLPDAWPSIALRARWLAASGREAEVAPLVEPFAEQEATGSEAAVARRLFEVAMLYREVNMPQQASTALHKLADLGPGYVGPSIDFLIANGDFQAAVDLSIRTIEQKLSPETAIMFCSTLARCDTAEQPWQQQAEPWLDRLPREFADDIEVLAAVGTVRLCQHRSAQAAELLERVLAIDPEHVQTLNNLALVLLEDADRLDESLRHIQLAIELRGRPAELLDTLGMVHLRRGENQQAVEAFRAACGRTEPGPQLLFHLAVAQIRQGELELARRTFPLERAAELRNTPITPYERQLIEEFYDRHEQFLAPEEAG